MLPENQESWNGNPNPIQMDTKVIANPNIVEYQWFQYGSPLEGETFSSLILRNISLKHSGVYAVEASNIINSIKMTTRSREIIVDIYEIPFIQFISLPQVIL